MSCIDEKLTPEEVEERAFLFVADRMNEGDEFIFAEHMAECQHCHDLVDKIKHRIITFRLIKFEERVDRFVAEHNVDDLWKSDIAKELREFADEYGLHDLIKKISPNMKAALPASDNQIKEKYNNLCTAFDNKDWQEVIRLGGEMEALGYDEEVHPIKSKIRVAESEMKLTRSETHDINSRSEHLISLIVDNVEKRYKWEDNEIVHLVDNDETKELKIIIGNEIAVDITLPEREESFELEDRSDDKFHFAHDRFNIDIYPGMFDYKIVITKK